MSSRLITNQNDWDSLVCGNGGHPLQLWGWGEQKAGEGNWSVERIHFDSTNDCVQILTRKLPGPFGELCFVPRGPLKPETLPELVEYVKTNHPKAIAVKIEPSWQSTAKQTLPKGWKSTKNDIFIAYTLILDLTQSEDELLADMSKKTRQYVRKSERDVIVHSVNSDTKNAHELIDKCLEIYRITAERAGFGLHISEYYHNLFDNLGANGKLTFAATKENPDEPICFLWNIVTPEIEFELYGGMNSEGQKLRANYFLKWQAILRAKRAGVTQYDMNGLVSDGVSTFKLGFVSNDETKATTLIGSLDFALSPLYFVYDKILPFGQKILRKIR